MKKALLSLLAGACAVTIAKADVTLSTLDWESDGGAWRLSNVVDETYSDNSFFMGFGFTTGSNVGGYSLGNVTFTFFDAEDGTDGSIQVRLYEANGENEPETALATFSGESTPLTAGLNTYTLASGYSLEASTTYWIMLVASGVTTGTYQLASVYPPDYPPPAEPSGWEFSYAGWTTTADDLWYLSYPEPFYTAFAIEISATAIPEPGTVWLLVGVGAMFLLQRRSSRRVVLG